jgi:hypothetical protein
MYCSAVSFFQINFVMSKGKPAKLVSFMSKAEQTQSKISLPLWQQGYTDAV